MSVFEEQTIIAILKATLDLKQQKKFTTDWDKAVKARVETWQKERPDNPSPNEQLTWEAHIVEYVTFIYVKTRVHGNAAKGTIPSSLDKRIPILGPRFIAPSYLCQQKRHAAPKITPITAHLKPLNIVHPFYYQDINTCPRCASKQTYWDSWTAKGSREVHGISTEEMALGLQLRCKDCQARGDCHYCVATTNPDFWEAWEHWKIPRGIPHFFKRCAVTRELFDFIIELRPTETSAGLAKHIRQFHLLEHRKAFLEYLQTFQSRRQTPFDPLELRSFCEPWNADAELGYAFDDTSITEDMVTEVYLEFSNRTRKAESDEYIRTLTGICLSLDHTFRCVSKATVADSKKSRSGPLKALLSVVNDGNEIVAWRFTQSQANAEIGEVLDGYKKRCTVIGVPLPEIVVADNCCHVRNEIARHLPDTDVVLDVFHLSMRYLACVVGGTRNPFRKEVAKDITGAILETRATGQEVAKYWPKEEQAKRLQSAYDKHAEHGGVWSLAASKVHLDQLRHVENGCLVRRRQDIACDGSRIEGSHKGWNSLQHAFTSGIVMFTALAHDFVLRRNVRIASAGRIREPTLFVKSIHGSHHIRLANFTAHLWNSILNRQRSRGRLKPLPTLPLVESGETFGVINSAHAATYGGWFEQKKEDESIIIDLSDIDETIIDIAIQDLGIEPSQLLHINPGPCAAGIEDSNVIEADQAAIFETTGIALDPKPSTGKRRSGSVSVNVADAPAYKRSRTEMGSQLHGSMIPSSSCAGPAAVVHRQSSVKQLTSDLPPAFQKFFAQRRSSTEDSPPETSPVISIPIPSDLTQPLPLPVTSQSSGGKYTRSERFFSLATNINIHALSVGRGNEFYVFMDLRAEQKWVTYSMTTSRYLRATSDFNLRLQQLSGPAIVLKTPRAIIDKLAEVEDVIANRIVTKNYLSKSGSETFWRRHCSAVALGKSEVPGELKSGRRPAVCGRCRTIMYPGPTGSPGNHRRGICADGVKSTSKADERLPEWPQPTGIFVNGTHFFPIEFLKTLKIVYEKYVVQEVPASDIPAEYDAFARMLIQRTVCSPLHPPAFKLFDLRMPTSTPEELFITIDSSKHLRLDALRDSDA